YRRGRDRCAVRRRRRRHTRGLAPPRLPRRARPGGPPPLLRRPGHSHHSRAGLGGRWVPAHDFPASTMTLGLRFGAKPTPTSFSSNPNVVLDQIPPRTDSQPQRLAHLRRDPPGPQVSGREPQRSVPSVKHDAVLPAAVVKQSLRRIVNVIPIDFGQHPRAIPAPPPQITAGDEGTATFPQHHLYVGSRRPLPNALKPHH